MISMEFLLSLIVFAVVVLMIVLVFQSLGLTQGKRRETVRPEYSYPDKLPGPPEKSVVQGVQTSMLSPSIHNEEEALRVAMTGHRDFVSAIDKDLVSNGNTGGIMGIEQQTYAKAE
jgi:hypothetical protein